MCITWTSEQVGNSLGAVCAILTTLFYALWRDSAEPIPLSNRAQMAHGTWLLICWVYPAINQCKQFPGKTLHLHSGFNPPTIINYLTHGSSAGHGQVHKTLIRKLLHTHDRAAAKQEGETGTGTGAGTGQGRTLCGKSPSPSQTTKRHVVNKFSIKFKASQKKEKKK